MSPTQRGVLKGLRQARDLALTHAKEAEEASRKAEPLGRAWLRWALQQRFAAAHAQALRAYARKLDREINRARGAQEELLER